MESITKNSVCLFHCKENHVHVFEIASVDGKHNTKPVPGYAQLQQYLLDESCVEMN